jgi:hypothetical protein
MSRPPDPFAFPLTRIDVVAHVGTLDPERRGVANRSSLEAFCLSVSVDPDTWRGIARCGGAPDWTLSRPGALWFDACSLSDAQEAEITDWAVSEGFAERMTLWRAWRYDDEADDWGFMVLPDEEAAISEAEEDWEESGPDGGPGVEPFDGVRLTATAMSALERWTDPYYAMGGLVILFADRVLAPALPDLVGVWWDELDDPLSLSCARGGVLPSRLPLLEIGEGWNPADPDVGSLAL